MAAQTQRMVLKEILIEDPDQFFKRETGAQAEAIQNEREETGKSQACGSKNPFGLRRLEDATVILRRVKDPRQILSNVEGVSKVRMTINCCEAAAVAETHLKGTLEPVNVNTEDESKLAMAASSQECSVDIIRSGSLDSPELSFSIKQDSVAIVGLTNLQDGGKTQTCQCSSNMSSNLNSLKEGEVTLNNQNLSEKPAVISNLQDAITTSSAESSSDKSVTWNNLEGSMLTVSPSLLSSFLDAELHPGQSSEAYDLPTPVSITTSPEDIAWWKHLSPGKECEVGDGKKDVDAEVQLNFSRLSNFEAYSELNGPELGSDLKGTKEMDDPRSSKKKRKRLLRDNTSEPRCPETPPDKGSAKKKRNCTRISPRLKRISGKTEESESKDAVECSKEEIRACKETERSESKEVETACEQESKAEVEDQDDAWDPMKLETETLIDALCRPMSLRSRRSSVIQDVSWTCAKLALEESKAEPQLGDLSVKEEMKGQSQCSVRKTDKKLRMKRPPLLHCDWLVGDLLWAKMAGHPWWPCMLTYDPSLGLYTKSSTVGKIIRTRYHVRFFGEKSYRAWIADGAILQYKGVEAFEQLCAQMLQTDLVHRSRDYYNVKESRRRAWDAAVEEAETMSRLSRKDRLLRCHSVYGTDSSKKSSLTADETRRSRKERRKSISYEKMEQKTPERKRRRRSEPPVQMKSNAKDPLSPDESPKLKDRKEDQNGNCTKEESKPEVLKLCGSGGMRKGNVCLSCEKEVSEEELVSCEGSCLGSFHRMCLGLAVGLSTPFTCDECTTGSHTCFVCKVTSVETVRCSVSLCGRFYHLECVKKFRLAHTDKRRLQCPLHTCATCAADDIKNPLASKGSLLRCVRCPTAYHSSDFCLAPGSERLAGNAIVCSRHLVKLASQQHVNVNWCFLCSKGGTLLCCESCPAAFHLDCLKIVTPPVGNWECEECTDGKRPLYGEIVWAKLGNYRWWPGEICHPRNIPDSLMGAPHKTGEFPVRFFGTHNYFWANIGRVFLFQEDDKGSRESVRNGLDKSFSRAVQEANAAIRVWMEEKEKRDQKSKAKVDRKPPPYKHLKASTVVGNVPVHRFNLDDIHPCSCLSGMVDPCGPESKCLNRDLSYECHPDVCPVGNGCQNRRFQQREYVPVVPFKTEDRGWGLKTLVDVKEGQFVIEYVGELIDHDESRRRMKEMQTRKNSSFYLLTLDKDRIIDAGPRGNVSRFMNHSCQPNCETQKWTVNGDSRIGLFSIIDIPAGSELTFNYNLDCLGNEKLACHCGSVICSGYLGLRPKQSTAVLSESSKKKRKRRVKKSFERIHEDECFRCGKTGQLIMCDKSQCPKVYHLKCLHLKKAPHGKWICPWHHCDDCGQPSTQLCNECDNSFCCEHIEGNIAEMFPGYLVCSEHNELKPVDDPSYGSVETGLSSEHSHSEKLGLCGMEGRDSEFEKTVEGKLGSETKRKWRRSSSGICEKNANGKRKRKRERELSTDALIQSEGETKLLEMASNNISSAASNRNSNGNHSATRKKMSPNTQSQGEDDLKLPRTGEKTSKNDASCKKKRSRNATSSAVSEKNSTRNCPTKRRRKSLPENQTQSEDVGDCFGTESGKTSKVSSKRSRNRRQTTSVINFEGVAKLRRKIEESSGESFTVDPIKTEDVAELSTVKTGEANQKKKRNSRKSSLLVIPAKRAKTECPLEKGHMAVTKDSMEAGMKSTKESRKKSLKIKNTEEGTKFLEVLKKTVSGVGDSKKKSRISKKSLASLNSSVVVQKASVVQKKKLATQKCSNFPLKISKTSTKNSTVLKYKLTCSKDLQKVLEMNVSRTHHETEFHNDALKSSCRKLKLGEEQKSRKRGRKLKLGEEQKSRKRGRKLKLGEKQRSRKSGRFMKQSDNSDDRNMETEEETRITLTDVAQVEIEATEMASLKTNESSALLLDTPVAERIEIAYGSEKEVTHLDVTDEKSKTEEDSMILKIEDETVASPVKLTKQKIIRKKGQRFGSGKRVRCKQLLEEKTGPRTETKNSEVNEDKMESQPKIQDLEVNNHPGLQIEQIETGSQKDSKNLTVKEDGMGSQKETENLEKLGHHDLQKQVAVVKILDDSKRGPEGIISEITKNIHSLPDSLTINSCNSKFKTDLYDTPSDSSESDGVLQVDGNFPAMKECTVWDKETEQNDSESGSSSSRKADERRIVLEENSNELESDCHGTSMDVGSYVQLDREKEECLADGQFPVVSKDVGVNAVMIDETQSVEILLPAESVGETEYVKHEAKLTNKDGLAVSSKTDESSEMVMLVASVENDNGAGSGITFIREPSWKRNHQISSGNTSLNSKDGRSKDCDLFPRTY